MKQPNLLFDEKSYYKLKGYCVHEPSYESFYEPGQILKFQFELKNNSPFSNWAHSMISLKQFEGSKMAFQSSRNAHVVKFDETCTITVTLRAPENPGKCFGLFKICYNDDYMFGETVSICFTVKG